MMEFFSNRYHIARKEHTCEACDQKIQIGEQYQYQSGKFEGEFFSRHYHTDCYMTLQDFFSDDPHDDTFTYDQVWDWWADKYCYGCALYYENGGECDRDMDKRIWCTKYKREK